MEDRKGEGRATRLAADAATKVGLARAKDWMPLRVDVVSSLDSVIPTTSTWQCRWRLNWPRRDGGRVERHRRGRLLTS